jgi:DNA-binding NtrC family response regulator
LLIEHNDERNFHPHRGPLCIVSSSTRDLRYETEEGRFLKDLLQQLAVVTLEVPPLHDRAQDLPAICDFLHRRYCRISGMPDRPFPAELLEYMRLQRWPGNLGELETFISRFVAPA